MQNYPESLINLINQLRKLPGIGSKSAERIALYLLDTNGHESEKLSQAITDLKNRIRYCRQCFNFSERELCSICNDTTRDHQTICVVEYPKDIQAIEKAKKYKGLYHVLLGKISPLEGINPDKLKIKELVTRIQNDKPQEIILATGADVEGEATALYLTKITRTLPVKLTRIAYGIPVGTSLEFADEMTLMRALQGRQAI